MTQPETTPATSKFCRDCGQPILAAAEICPKCGCRQLPPPAPISPPSPLDQLVTGPKNRKTAVLLAVLLGGVGAHKFYLGQPAQGALYILFVWTFIPAIFGLIEGLNMLFMSDPDFQSRIGTRKI